MELLKIPNCILLILSRSCSILYAIESQQGELAINVVFDLYGMLLLILIIDFGDDDLQSMDTMSKQLVHLGFY